MKMNFSEITLQRLEQYYIRYYCETLGLPNGLELAKQRRQEEKKESERIRIWEQYVGSLEGKTVLNVGCGTGGFNIALAAKGISSIGFDPDSEAIEIAKMKAEESGLDKGMFTIAKAEELPFEDARFDLVYCYTVLEHVQDVSKTIQEIVRVLKKDGKAYIDCPHGLNLYEGHYKVFFLPIFRFVPLGKIYLRLLKRPPGFLDTLNFITYNRVRNSVKNQPVSFQVIKHLPKPTGIYNSLAYVYYKILGIAPQVEMVITKKS